MMSTSTTCTAHAQTMVFVLMANIADAIRSGLGRHAMRFDARVPVMGTAHASMHWSQSRVCSAQQVEVRALQLLACVRTWPMNVSPLIMTAHRTALVCRLTPLPLSLLRRHSTTMSFWPAAFAQTRILATTARCLHCHHRQRSHGLTHMHLVLRAAVDAYPAC